jgi:hypothetical protein
MVGEKRTPESDVAVAMSRLPTTDDKDTTKSDRLLQTIRAQAYKTSNPAAFRGAVAPAPAATASPYSPAILAKAQQAMNDPQAPPAAKIAAAKVLSAR